MGDGGGRRATTKCCPSSSFALTCRANSEKDGTGRHNTVSPGRGPGRTDCPVASTGGRGGVAIPMDMRSVKWGAKGSYGYHSYR